jgi:hypothetical protein
MAESSNPNQTGIISAESAIALVVALVNLALDQADIHVMIISWISVLACISLCVDVLRRTPWARHPRYGDKRLTIGSVTIVMAFLGFGAFLSLHKKAVAETPISKPPEVKSLSNPEAVVPDPLVSERPMRSSNKSNKTGVIPREVTRTAPVGSEPLRESKATPAGTPPINQGPCGVVQIGGTQNTATGGNCGIAPPHLVLKYAGMLLDAPDRDAYKSTAELDIISQVAIAKATVTVTAQSLVALHVLPIGQGDGFIWLEESPITNGKGRISLTNVFGRYLITIITKNIGDRFGISVKCQPVGCEMDSSDSNR